MANYNRSSTKYVDPKERSLYYIGFYKKGVASVLYLTPFPNLDLTSCILNDNDVGVDHLQQSVYAEAISESIHKVETPITIGLFARWGSGKSFLVKHILSMLKKYQKQAEHDKNQSLKSRTSCCGSNKRCLIGILFCVITLSLAAVAIILIVKPDTVHYHTPSSANDLTKNLSEYLNTSVSYTYKTTTTTTIPTNRTATTAVAFTTTSILEKTTASPRDVHLRTVRYVGIGLLLSEIILVLLITFCGRNWTRKSYYGKFRIIMYAMFTKIPLKKYQTSEVIGDPGESYASVLKRATPEEVAAAASLAEDTLPRKYIFATFRAWEFAGSDSLWAGIITTISDAVEAEFGKVTSRLFRITQISELPPTRLIKNDISSREFYISLENKRMSNQAQEVKKAMQLYGVVLQCKNIHSHWWKVQYSQIAEARYAYECLEIDNVKIQKSYPKMSTGQGFSPSSEKISESHDLIENPSNEIEMKDLNGKREQAIIQNNMQDSTNTNNNNNNSCIWCCCCKRFCMHFSRHPTLLCCCPYLFWLILAIFCFLIIPSIIFIIAEVLELETFRTYRGVSFQAQVLLWLPGSVSVVFIAVRFTWAMFHSQRSRIQQALDGTKKRMAAELGFMSKVKGEVEVMTKLIQCAKFVFQKDYKIVITIDDLDRVPMDKVKSVLGSVSILLSDRSSPFICIVAVDSRVAVKCIEQDMGEVLTKANVTGHEYLKKIINLPVCLPQVENASKKRYIAGLIDQADNTFKKRQDAQQNLTDDDPFVSGYTNSRQDREIPSNKKAIREGADGKQRNKNSSNQRPYSLDLDGRTNIRGDFTDHSKDMKETILDGDTPTDLTERRSSTPGMRKRNKSYNQSMHQPLISPDVQVQSFDEKSFLFRCREFFYTGTNVGTTQQHQPESCFHHYLEGTPRNIKRIFNVISLTSEIITCQQRRKHFRMVFKIQNEQTRNYPIPSVNAMIFSQSLVEDVVHWIVLTDQWPYRMSYILQVIEDADQRVEAGKTEENIDENDSLHDIYKNHVLPELHSSEQSLLGLDSDPDVFLNFLVYLKKSNLTKGNVKQLSSWTINLDRSLRQTIAYHRDHEYLPPGNS